MNEIFKLFLFLSISGSIIGLVIIFIKLLLKNKIGKTWYYYIWLVVIIPMLIPFSMEVSIVKPLFYNVENNTNIDIQDFNYELDILELSNIDYSEYTYTDELPKKQ